MQFKTVVKYHDNSFKTMTTSSVDSEAAISTYTGGRTHMLGQGFAKMTQWLLNL